MENKIDSQYRHLNIDTVAWSKANHSAEQQKAICQFMINKYSMREKGQDVDDCSKIDFYNNWLKDIASGDWLEQDEFKFEEDRILRDEDFIIYKISEEQIILLEDIKNNSRFNIGTIIQVPIGFFGCNIKDYKPKMKDSVKYENIVRETLKI